ncbi:MAG: TetR/AcrR family transcriptional regulator, partial [Clostridia bacterium]|nr:TetR/AcrR family transcriptional regulator [Clostridia bacterium]
NSAINEFTNKQFNAASTDIIVKNAGISKGALFQYFGTKKNLFFYIYKYAFDILKKELWEQLDLSITDPLERIKSVLTIKMKLLSKYPNLINFILNINLRETDPEIKEMVEKDTNIQKEKTFYDILAGVDYSKLKKEFEPKQIIAVIIWVLEGYANSQMQKLKNENITITSYEQWEKEINQYINILKISFYEEEK